MSSDEPKHVIVIRKDLKMRKGKIGAQCSHCAKKLLLELMSTPVVDRLPSVKRIRTLVTEAGTPLEQWLSERFKTIVVYVNSEEELLDRLEKAKQAGIYTTLITDAGLTEFDGVPTHTCIGIGPDKPEIIDQITGDLPLF